MAKAATADPIYYPPRATDVAHAWLRSPIYRELESEAIRRGEHVDQLTAKIVTGAIILGSIDEIISSTEQLLAR